MKYLISKTIFSILLTLFGAYSSLAQEKAEAVTSLLVRLSDSKEIDCQLDSLSKVYICKHEKEITLLKSLGPFGYRAMTVFPDESFKIITPSLVRSMPDKHTIYENAFVNSMTDTNTFLSWKPSNVLDYEYSEKVLPVEDFFMEKKYHSKGVSTSIVEGGLEFNSLRDAQIKKRDAYLERDKSLRDSTKLTIELEDGQRVICNKNKLDLRPCDLYKCEPVVINGKRHDATLAYNTDYGVFDMPKLFIDGQGELPPEILLKKIEDTASQTVLIDNSQSLAMYKDPNNAFAQKQIDAENRSLPKALAPHRERLKSAQEPMHESLWLMRKGLCQDSISEVNRIMTENRKLLERLATEDFIELLDIAEGNRIVNSFVTPEYATSLHCTKRGHSLTDTAFKKYDKIESRQSHWSERKKTVTRADVARLFDEAKKMNDIAWKYKQDGCYARAHLVAKRMEKKGIYVDKAWISGNLYVDNSDPPLYWRFHVAPLVYVKNNQGVITPTVIDPALFDKPVSLDQWDAKITKLTVGGSVKTSFPFPENVSSTQRAALAISSSDPYLPDEEMGMSDEQKMKLANKTMKEYLGVETDQR